MRRYYTIEKKVGETPLHALSRLREKHGINPEIPLSYAGRLDPMASGTLLVLCGEECKKQEKYHRLDKIYRFEVLFGASSDTGDVLGIVSGTRGRRSIDGDMLQKVCRSLEGSHSLPYPVYSSKTVKGIPLHTWALQGKLHLITIPLNPFSIYSINFTGVRSLSAPDLLSLISKKIFLLPTVTDPKKALGKDFRRAEVHESWKIFIEKNQGSFQIATFEASVSAGTYIRSLAPLLGEKLGMDALAYSIHRVRIGRYLSFFKGFGIWTRWY